MKLALIYTFLSLIAMGANFCAQELVVQVYDDAWSIFLSVVMGTGVGLIVKYTLDKRYIFFFKSKNMAHESQVFLMYSTMAIITTAIFWGFEFGFNFVFQTKEMRYLGGVIGLAIGYFVKYQMDKRYVFSVKSS